MPAITSPPAAAGCSEAASTRHSASIRWSGSAKMSAIWPVESTASTAARSSVPTS